MIHLLGFDSQLFEYFPILKQPKGTYYQKWEELNILHETADGIDRLYVKSSEVISKAQEYFGCDNIEKGIEWEN